ncbi:DUF1349 domain-containing protein [Photobacterium sp. SDRW27]|uniref:DUF1349 domain-containing protein n=1 Tax=Photobacterium obscurum TaxID=2829490 RepID=UPI002243EAF0|nr:DUF1349 domain-containing protein [Photobacterium obscurum]MCW8330773.1 DUF1349 domain-containing protein [Photobacterium obscurum]
MNAEAMTWLNRPKQFSVNDGELTIVTEPETDFWQRSYYGFQNENAPALLATIDENFTLSVRVRFEYKMRFDQAGIVIYLNKDNWFKASIEYENSDLSRLGSVVTNFGYSDWASNDIASVNEVWFRLSRRGPDFLIESSLDGRNYQQMRVFHLHLLGETKREMGWVDPPPPASLPISVGYYACSPQDSSFVARFDDIKLGLCSWPANGST